MTSKILKKTEIKSEDEPKQKTFKCHGCKKELQLPRFYSSKGVTDSYRCKDCYKAEYKRIIRETPLF